MSHIYKGSVPGARRLVPGVALDLRVGSQIHASDECTNRILNPEGILKYTKVKVPHTQNKHWSAEQLHRAAEPLPLTYKKFTAASLPEYVATHSHQTDYLRPCELDTRCEYFWWFTKCNACELRDLGGFVHRTQPLYIWDNVLRTLLFQILRHTRPPWPPPPTDCEIFCNVSLKWGVFIAIGGRPTPNSCWGLGFFTNWSSFIAEASRIRACNFMWKAPSVNDKLWDAFKSGLRQLQLMRKAEWSECETCWTFFPQYNKTRSHAEGLDIFKN